MTPINLISDLARELRGVVKSYNLIAELQNKKPVTVYEEILPTANFEDDTFFPLMVVNLQSVEDGGEGSFAIVEITFGVFGGYKEDGWRDLLNIMEHTRQYLLTHKLIGGKFYLQLPSATEFPDFQPEPFFEGRMTLKYTIGQPGEDLEGYN